MPIFDSALGVNIHLNNHLNTVSSVSSNLSRYIMVKHFLSYHSISAFSRRVGELCMGWIFLDLPQEVALNHCICRKVVCCHHPLRSGWRTSRLLLLVLNNKFHSYQKYKKRIAYVAEAYFLPQKIGTELAWPLTSQHSNLRQDIAIFKIEPLTSADLIWSYINLLQNVFTLLIFFCISEFVTISVNALALQIVTMEWNIDVMSKVDWRTQ